MTGTRQSRAVRRPRLRLRRVTGLITLALALVVCGVLLSTQADDSKIVLRTQAGSKVSGTVRITAAIKTNLPIAYVIFRINGEGYSSTNRKPYAFDLDTTQFPNGLVEIIAEAHTRGALIGRSPALSLTVANATQPQPSKAIGDQGSEPKAPEPAPPALPVRPMRPADEPTPSVAQGHLPGAVAGADSVTPEAGGSGARVSAAAGAAPKGESLADTGRGVPVTLSAQSESLRAAAAVDEALRAMQPAGGVAPSVLVNGERLDLPLLQDLRFNLLYVAFRPLMEHLGARVGWEHQTKHAWADWNDRRIIAGIGERMVQIDGHSYAIGTRPVLLQDGRTLIPLRAYGDAVGLTVVWDGSRREAYVVAPGAALPHAEILPSPH